MFASSADTDQVLAPEDLRRPDFRHIDGDSLDLPQNVQDRVRAARANCPSLAVIPAPRRIVVRVVAVGTPDMWLAVPPPYAELGENVDFVALERSLDDFGDDVSVILATARHEYRTWATRASRRGSVKAAAIAIMSLASGRPLGACAPVPAV